MHKAREIRSFKCQGDSPSCEGTFDAWATWDNGWWPENDEEECEECLEAMRRRIQAVEKPDVH